jgi:hypothetical protein
MSGCPAQTFSGITQEQFACIAQKAQAASGVALSGNSGTASQSGLTITWNYDPAAQTLTIQCTDKPFFPTCGMIASQIESVVKGCTGS